MRLLTAWLLVRIQPGEYEQPERQAPSETRCWLPFRLHRKDLVRAKPVVHAGHGGNLKAVGKSGHVAWAMPAANFICRKQQLDRVQVCRAGLPVLSHAWCPSEPRERAENRLPVLAGSAPLAGMSWPGLCTPAPDSPNQQRRSVPLSTTRECYTPFAPAHPEYRPELWEPQI